MGKAKRKITTMTELAKAIEVSRPTLSRYFQDPASVRPATAQKIKGRLAGVDYVYNFIATRQNRKSTGLIGVVIPYYNDLFFTSLLNSIEETARAMGFTVIMQSSNGEIEGEARAVGKLRSMNADGAIIAPFGIASSNDTLLLASKDFPIVFTDSRPATAIAGADFVGTDNIQSMSVIVEYLHRTGDAPIFLGMPLLNTNAVERENAFKAKAQELEFSGRMIEIENTFDSWRFEAYGFAVMDHHFSHRRYTQSTILCANDRIAIGAMQAAHKHGLFHRGRGAEGALRIAGHDDHPMSRYMYPALTTVAQDVTGLGQDAVRLLIERIRKQRGGDSVEVLKQAALKVRESA